MFGPAASSFCRERSILLATFWQSYIWVGNTIIFKKAVKQTLRQQADAKLCVSRAIRLQKSLMQIKSQLYE
jgi:hypothetical protein